MVLNIEQRNHDIFFNVPRLFDTPTGCIIGVLKVEEAYNMQMKDSSKKKINVNIDRNLADETQAILDELGLNQTTAIVMFYKKIVANGGIPFEIKLNERQRAINELQKTSKKLPIEDLTDEKKLKEWLNDESQDY